MSPPEKTTEENVGPRLLVIDDEPAIAAALQRDLSAAPFTIVAQTDAEAARDLLATESFDVVLTDNLMPNLTGMELMQAVKAQHPEMRRIMLTGQTDLEDAVRAMNEGVIHRFLTKPWKRTELLQVLIEELDQLKRWQSERKALTQLLEIARKRAGTVNSAKRQLKEARTELFLYKEGPDLAKMRISAQLRGQTIVHVEPNQDISRLLAETLKKAGIPKVHAVATGSAALELIKSLQKVDIVLCEWNLPDYKALDFLEALRDERSPASRAVCMVLTTRENRDSVEAALRGGADQYLLKPFHPRVLVQRLDELVTKKHSERLEGRIRELKPLTIIVANAEQERRMEIQAVLANSGIQNIALADSGQKALRWILAKQPDVVIYDCNLRDPYWLDLEKALLAEDSAAALPPLVLTSGTPIKKEYEEVYEAQLTTFLPGAILRRDLLRNILRALEQRSDQQGPQPAI